MRKWFVFYCRNRSIGSNNVCYSREVHIMARGDGADCVNSVTIFGNRYSHSERPQLLSQSYITQCTVTYDTRMDEFSPKFVSSSHCARRIYGGDIYIYWLRAVRWGFPRLSAHIIELAANILPLAACLRDRIVETCSRCDISGRKVAFVRPQC